MPQPTTLSAMASVGMFSTHSPLARSSLCDRPPGATTQPIRGGSNSSIVCQDIVITLRRWRCAVLSSSTGPGSSSA